jgi:hypothetical protein
VAPERAPVQQLAPGDVALARVQTVQGPVVIALQRIRYLGKVALCMSESNHGATGQSCANYPLGPKSNRPIGNAPVWWTTFVGACTSHHFQVISGVVLRRGLTAWLHTPSGVARMPTAAIPRDFQVAGNLVYALVGSASTSVSLRNASGKTVYAEPVEPLPASIPTVRCNGSAVSVGVSGGAIP